MNSIRYSGIRGHCASELALKASARCWGMVEDAPIVMDGNASKCDVSEKEVADRKPSKRDIRLVAGILGVRQKHLYQESQSHD